MSRAENSCRGVGVLAGSVTAIGIVASGVGGLDALPSIRDLLPITAIGIVTAGVVVLCHLYAPDLTDRGPGADHNVQDSQTDSTPENGA